MTFTSLQFDGLREIINVGGGHAATSIAEMTGKRIEMDIPDVKVLEYSGVFEQIVAAEAEVYAVHNRLEGDLGGAFLFVVSHETAQLLVELMTGTEVDDIVVTESAINELGNIISNSFLRAVGDMLKLEVKTSLPTLLNDLFGALITSTYMELEQYDEQILVIRNEFKYADKNLDASLFFIPSEGNLEKIFGALGL